MPDGRTAFYATSEGFFPATRQATIFTSSMQSNGTWSTPVIAPFSGTHADMDPVLTHDGTRLYFSSIRPDPAGTRADLDLFVVTRNGAGWSEPVRLGAEVNSDIDELYPSVSDDGTLYFASGPLTREDSRDFDIYSASPMNRGFAAKVRVPVINVDLPFNASSPTADWDFNPEISADGKMLLFTSHRPGGFGFGDIYVSRAVNGSWSVPVNAGPLVNTADDEFHPTLTRDRRSLIFGRTIFSGAQVVPGDFYQIDLRHIGLLGS